jgi:hypothetical protein
VLAAAPPVHWMHSKSPVKGIGSRWALRSIPRQLALAPYGTAVIATSSTAR